MNSSLNTLPKIGTQHHLRAMGKAIFVITEIKSGDIFPIGIARLGESKTQFYVRSSSLKPLVIAGHTDN